MREMFGNLLLYLESKGFVEILDEPQKLILVSERYATAVSIVDQKNDGIEVWIKKNKDTQWLRLDFIFEYYLSGKTDLTKKFYLDLKNKETAFRYYIDFLNKYFDIIFADSSDFGSKYNQWMKENFYLINKISELLKDNT